jgi:hypothetical protein
LTRLLATLLSLNRIAFGLSFLVSPESAGLSWIRRRRASRADTAVFIRATGARDLALGAGALAALATGDMPQAKRWMLGHAIADGSDLAATVAVRGKLPGRASKLAIPIAGASTAIAAWSAFVLGRSRSEQSG